MFVVYNNKKSVSLAGSAVIMSGGGSGGNNPLEQLEQQLERSIENVRQIRIIVSDFQPQGQQGLNQVNSKSHKGLPLDNQRK